MELRGLRYFVTVAEELHFGRAARRLHIVQPAVSQQVARLERELGVRLLDRSRRHVRLTTAGTELLGPARAALAAAEQVRRLAGTLGGGIVVRVGTGPGFTVRLEKGIAALRGANPEVDLRLVDLPVTERLDAVRRGELDFALVRGMRVAAGLRLLPVWTEPLLAVLPAGHPFAARSSVPLAELAEIPLRFPAKDADPPLHEALTAAFSAAGIEPRTGRPIGTVADTLVEIGSAGQSWTLLPAETISSTGLSSVVGIPLDPPLAVTGSIATPEGFHAECAAEVIAAFELPDAASVRQLQGQQ